MRSTLAVAAAATVAAAGPALAIIAKPGLPYPPRNMVYVDAICRGGIDGRSEITRVLADGQVLRMSVRTGAVLRAQATPAEVTKIMRGLDRARLEQRTVAPTPGRTKDGVDCQLLRGKDLASRGVMLRADAAGRSSMKDLFQVLADVNALGSRATTAAVPPVKKP